MVIATIITSILYSSDRDSKTALRLMLTFAGKKVVHVLLPIVKTKTPRKLTMTPELEN